MGAFNTLTQDKHLTFNEFAEFDNMRVGVIYGHIETYNNRYGCIQTVSSAMSPWYQAAFDLDCEIFRLALKTKRTLNQGSN